MRDLVRQGLGGLDEEDIGDPEVDRLLNLSYWDLEARFPFEEKDFRVSFVLTVDQDEYSIVDDLETPNDVFLEALQSLGMFGDPTSDDQFQSYPMQRMTESEYDKIRNTRPDDNQGRPEMYLRRDETIVFFPIPDKAYTASVYFKKTLKSLKYREIEALNFPREWDEIVVEGAITRGHYYAQDYTLAQQAEDFRVSHVRTAVPVEGKEEEDSHYAGLNVQWSDPGIGVTPGANVASDDPYPGSTRWFWRPFRRGRN